jgi:hypothetical protein
MLLDLSKPLQKVIGFTNLLIQRESEMIFALSDPVALESHSNCDRTSDRTKSVRVSRMRRTTGQESELGCSAVERLVTAMMLAALVFAAVIVSGYFGTDWLNPLLLANPWLKASLICVAVLAVVVRIQREGNKPAIQAWENGRASSIPATNGVIT